LKKKGVKRSERVNYTFTGNKKPYGIIFLISVIGGVFLYHQYGKIIDKYTSKIPYLKNLPSYYAAAAEGDEIN
jgi:hypothetical protein